MEFTLYKQDYLEMKRDAIRTILTPYFVIEGLLLAFSLFFIGVGIFDDAEAFHYGIPLLVIFLLPLFPIVKSTVNLNILFRKMAKECETEDVIRIETNEDTVKILYPATEKEKKFNMMRIRHIYRGKKGIYVITLDNRFFFVPKNSETETIFQ